MKSDIILNELRKELEKLNKHKSKITIFLILFITCISIIFVLLSLKSKSRKSLNKSLDENDFYEDYYALDYEEEV